MTSPIASRLHALSPNAWPACAAASRRRACARWPTARWRSRRTRWRWARALTHPCITTDFSESQLELITAAHASAAACAAELREIHRLRLLRAIGDGAHVGLQHALRPAAPTRPSRSARYGTSNVGRAKSVYRMGLGHRYGRRMQTISGIHYNWSLPGLGNDEYFALIRNFRRHSFLLLCSSAPRRRCARASCRAASTRCSRWAPTPTGLPHATSLRMGRLGYQSDAQAALNVSYNSLEGYAASLHGALTTPHPAYEAIGVRNLGGEYNQLATTPAADRERVLRHHPPQARHPQRRAAAARAARARRGVRGGALHGPRPLRAGGHRRADRCASSTCSCCTACWPTARRTRRRDRPRSRATSTSRPPAGASRACAWSARAGT
jgi:hypothetical protein